MICNKTIAIRIKFVAFIVVCLFVALVGRLYFVQVARHGELFSKAQKQYTTTKKTTGKRGEIYDYNGNLLVGNIPCSTVVADPTICGDEENCKKIALILGKYLDVKPAKIYRSLMNKTLKRKKKDGTYEVVKRRYAHIANNVPLPLSEKLKEILKRMKLRGIDFVENTQRYYPKNELLANILGFTSIDRDQIVANLGIEKYFNKVIAPTGVEYRYERSRDGVPLMVRNDQTVRVRDGINIFLTIQEPIQAILEEELDKLMEKWHPRAAYAIMVDPHNGNIMAIAQRPTFNPNDRSTMNSDAYRSRVTADVFDPGSTMKPIAISGAIDSGVVTPQTRFHCEKGRWLYCGHWLHDSHGYEFLSVAQIIQKSSNIGTAKIAIKMGKQMLYNTLYGFGFGQRTGIPMKPETRGILHKPKKWDGLSITQFPMGQGVSCSPVQLARAYCALANGGRLVGLRLVDRVEVPDTGVTIKYTAAPAKRIYRNRNTHRQMIEMMKMVTRPGGTATIAAVPGYEVAGKTGTSQKAINGRYSQTKFFATFVGFVPADNPRFVLLVTADEPQGGHYGGLVAGPTFRKIAERTLRFLNVKPTLPIENYDPRR